VSKKEGQDIVDRSGMLLIRPLLQIHSLRGQRGSAEQALPVIDVVDDVGLGDLQTVDVEVSGEVVLGLEVLLVGPWRGTRTRATFRSPTAPGFWLRSIPWPPRRRCRHDRARDQQEQAIDAAERRFEVAACAAGPVTGTVSQAGGEASRDRICSTAPAGSSASTATTTCCPVGTG
jgi:hypothetical protein